MPVKVRTTHLKRQKTSGIVEVYLALVKPRMAGYGIANS